MNLKEIKMISFIRIQVGVTNYYFGYFKNFQINTIVCNHYNGKNTIITYNKFNDNYE